VTGRTRSGIWMELFGSMSSIGRSWMLIALDPKSLGETARSISKARMSVKSRALVLVHTQRRFRKKIRRDVDE
jgi:hypothetical protein